MKAQNLNNGSVKTRKLIRKTFAEMLSEKRELSKISVSELTKRANINRGTFYTHYDDIYGVAEDYENELIDEFFDNDTLLSADNFPKFLDALFEYIKENENEYRLLCRSDDFISVMKRLILLAENKLLELCHSDKRLKNKAHLSLEINVFIEGILIQYIKYCRGQSAVTPPELKEYTNDWVAAFIQNHFSV